MSQQSLAAFETYLANIFILSLKTKNFHWNVKGPHFYSLHKLFEEQYDALDEALDETAETIRQMGAWVKASLSQYQAAASLKCESGHLTATDMVAALVADHHTVIKHLEAIIADEACDFSADQEDFLIARLYDHRKAAWMLESSLP